MHPCSTLPARDTQSLASRLWAYSHGHRDCGLGALWLDLPSPPFPDEEQAPASGVLAQGTAFPREEISPADGSPSLGSLLQAGCLINMPLLLVTQDRFSHKIWGKCSWVRNPVSHGGRAQRSPLIYCLFHALHSWPRWSFVSKHQRQGPCSE